MFKQCKAHDYSKLRNIVIQEYCQGWLCSIKYDGNYVQVAIKNGLVHSFTTSGGKEFFNEDVAVEIGKLNLKDGIYECEYLGLGDGKLGGRVEAAVITSMRTNFSKGLKSYGKHNVAIFDYISETECFEDRLAYLKSIDTTGVDLVFVVSYTSVDDIMNELKAVRNEGWEGLILKSPKHVHVEGKRVKTSLKVKAKNVARLHCIDVEIGQGKYMGAIGSLVLEDCNGVIVKVGSGLTDELRYMPHEAFVGKKVLISYEQKLSTYIHPIFIGVADA